MLYIPASLRLLQPKGTNRRNRKSCQKKKFLERGKSDEWIEVKGIWLRKKWCFLSWPLWLGKGWLFLSCDCWIDDEQRREGQPPSSGPKPTLIGAAQQWSINWQVYRGSIHKTQMNHTLKNYFRERNALELATDGKKKPEVLPIPNQQFSFCLFVTFVQFWRCWSGFLQFWRCWSGFCNFEDAEVVGAEQEGKLGGRREPGGGGILLS